MTKSADRRDAEDSLAIRAAWLHYAAGQTQADVAARLGVSSVKAHRLIMRANQSGAVKFTIDGDVAECVVLEAELAQRFGLSYCEVVPDLNEGDLPLRALGVAGAHFMQREIATRQGGVIGIGHGRTLAAVVENIPRLDAGTVRFVSLLGGVTRKYTANPYDVIHRLAEQTGAVSYVLPLPFFANKAEDREVLLAQRGVREVFDMAAHADLMVVGIGSVNADAQLVASQMIEPDEIQEVRDKGGQGELLGHFFSDTGQSVETSLAARTVAPELDDLKGRRIIAIAGGASKIAAIRAVLNSGLLSGLITDEASALALKMEPVATEAA
ncbi:MULTISPECIES: sugar-binding transcriptional regulator [unclassified Caballeronia]|uniref:sugar-binding transcriptional regulator n=1 Tax=unclassified Caballeronia TaxID=2646786 RepID=UPI001FD06126|nr:MULTISPECIES: sugar-binding transcriptional regulator [unclassified Caballeronia]MDR5773103.1 sugar-binding transcriptional regulator [Caballeronia sp. LZ002]MDR5799984.1 sugar-binding transcriptional regulator [Caballeronia sp. LZ001]MDR5848537.1 sugar-binding transcriptional regulator [Caballeronia sp. LZ003]